MNENLSNLDNSPKTYSPASPKESSRSARSPFKDISNKKVSNPISHEKEISPKSSDTSWSERTEVITKQYHENYVNYSQEVVDKIVNDAFVISHKKKSEFTENGKLKSEGDSDSEYEDAFDDSKDVEYLTACNHHEALNLSSPHSQEAKHIESINAIDKEVKGALELLKSFEKLGVSSPNTCKASLQRAQSRLSDDTFNPFSFRTSIGDSQKETSIECQSENFDNLSTVTHLSCNETDNEAHKVISLDRSHSGKDETPFDSTNVQDDKIPFTSFIQNEKNLHLSDLEDPHTNMNKSVPIDSISPNRGYDAPSSSVSHASEVKSSVSELANDKLVDNLLLRKDSIKCDIESIEISFVNIIDPSPLKSDNCDQLNESVVEKNVANNLNDTVNLSPVECEIRVGSHDTILDNEDSSFIKDMNVTDGFSTKIVLDEGHTDKENTIMNKTTEKDKLECNFENNGSSFIDGKDLPNINNFETIVNNCSKLAVQDSPAVRPQEVEDICDYFEKSLKGKPVNLTENLEDAAVSFTTSIVENSSLSKPQELKDKMEDIGDSLPTKLDVETSSLVKLEDVKDNLEDISEPITTKSIGQDGDSPVIKPPFIMDGFQENADPLITNLAKNDSQDISDSFITKLTVENSPESKYENIKGSFEDIVIKGNLKDIADPFSTKLLVKNSPVGKSEDVKDNVEDIVDSFCTKLTVKESPVRKTENIKNNLENIFNLCSESSVKNSSLRKAEDIKDNVNIIDHFGTKSAVENSPVRKPEDVNGNLEDIVEPFCTKAAVIQTEDVKDDFDLCAESCVINSPVRKAEDVKDNVELFCIEAAVIKTEDVKDDVDPCTKSSVKNSPVRKVDVKDNVEDIVESFCGKTTVMKTEDVKDDVDPCTKSSVKNSPVRKAVDIKDNFEDIIDPFCTKSTVENSPVIKLEDGKGNIEAIVEPCIEAAVMKTVDVKANVNTCTKSSVKNSPVRKAVDVKNNVEDIIDPFCTKSTVENSPVRKLEDVKGNIEAIVEPCIEAAVMKTEDVKVDVDSCTTKSSVKNSPVQKAVEVKDNVEDIVEPFCGKTTVMKTEDVKDDVDPCTKSPVKNSPVRKAVDVKDNVEDITDPFCIKSTVENSPVRKLDVKGNIEAIVEPCIEEAVMKTEDVKDDVDSCTKSSGKNSPVRKAVNVKDNVEDIIDPFCTKSTVENSPVRKPEDLEGNIEYIVEPFCINAAVMKTEDVKDDVDPCTKSSVKDSPVRKIEDVKDIVDPLCAKSTVKNSSVIKSEGNDCSVDTPGLSTIKPTVKSSPLRKPEGTKSNFKDISDPFATKSTIENSPISKLQHVKDNFEDPFASKCTVQNSPLNKFNETILSKNDENFSVEKVYSKEKNSENIPDSFSLKSDVENSPVKNPVDLKDTGNFPPNCPQSESKDVKDHFEGIVDPFSTKSTMMNSPLTKPKDIKENLENVIDPFSSKSTVENSPVRKLQDVKDNFEDFIDPFSSKSTIQNSPVRILEDVKDNFDIINPVISKSTVKDTPIRKPENEKENFEDIADPFVTKLAIKNSPLRKPEDVKDSLEDSADPFITKSAVKSSPLKKPEDVKDNFEDINDPFSTKLTVENSPVSKLNLNNNLEEILDPFDGKDTVQNVSLNKLDDNAVKTNDKSFPTENDSSKEDSLDNTLVLDSTIVQSISNDSSKTDTVLENKNISTVNAECNNSSLSSPVNKSEVFLANDFSNTSDVINQVFDDAEREKLEENVDNAREMRKSISSVEFDIIAKEALNLAKDVTPQPPKSRKDQIGKSMESIKISNFCIEEFSSAKEFFSNEEELDALGSFGNNESNENLARNSLFVKFDPLLAASMDSNSDSRRGSALIKFSPFKKPSQEPIQLPLLKPDATANESTFMDETFMGDCNTTVLVKMEDNLAINTCKSTTSTETQTELEIVSAEEKESAIKKLEIMFQDKLLRSSREYEEMKEALVYELTSKEKSLKEVEEDNNKLRCLVKQFETMMEKMVAKKVSMEKEFQDQLKANDEKRRLEIKSLEQKLERQQEESTGTDQAFFELVKKQDRLRQVAQTLKNNNFLLEERNKELEQTLAEKREAFVKTVQDLKAKMIEVDATNGEEMKKLENEMTRSAFLLKRAEMKIISLTEAGKKKDEEIAALSGLLDDCSSKFG